MKRKTNAEIIQEAFDLIVREGQDDALIFQQVKEQRPRAVLLLNRMLRKHSADRRSTHITIKGKTLCGFDEPGMHFVGAIDINGYDILDKSGAGRSRIRCEHGKPPCGECLDAARDLLAASWREVAHNCTIVAPPARRHASSLAE